VFRGFSQFQVNAGIATEFRHRPLPSASLPIYYLLTVILFDAVQPEILKKTPWLLVRKRTIPIERPPLVGEVNANYCADRGCRVVSATDPHSR
jgi:hypothetical protein